MASLSDAPPMKAPPATPAAPQGAGQGAPPKLDDVMLAMDVVDTLRHQESLVTRELDEEQREAELIDRLRTIYRNQGIEVPDAVLAEGVRALKESRFTYTPPAPSFGTRLAGLWINRGRLGALIATAVGVVAVAWIAYSVLVAWPREREAEQARIELAETLPRALEAARLDIKEQSRDPAADAQADQILADGRAALARGDAAAGQKAAADLTRLATQLRQSYQLMIVGRPGEPSGAFRIPGRNQAARNYYVIVEAIGPDGVPLALPITSEEDGSTKTVTKWGLRVSQAAYDAVRRDKMDDGIIQNRKVGEKRRGTLAVEYSMPVQGGAITEW